MRGGEKAEEEKGVEVSGGFFMVSFNYKQPAWWGRMWPLNIQRDP